MANYYYVYKKKRINNLNITSRNFTNFKAWTTKKEIGKCLEFGKQRKKKEEIIYIEKPTCTVSLGSGRWGCVGGDITWHAVDGGGLGGGGGRDITWHAVGGKMD